MQIANLDSLPPDSTIETDLVILGGGPAGLTIAREFFGTSVRVLVLESGELKEKTCFSGLNAVESIGEPRSAAQVQKRIQLVGPNCPSWSHETQPFGMRCRVLGGSTEAWLGKSTLFDDIDFAKRDWVPYSGWPFRRETLSPYFDRAAQALNLGPNRYDDRVWDLMRRAPPLGELDAGVLGSWFWQFARSHIDHRDILRLGPEFIALDAANVRVLVNATVTRVDTDQTGGAFEALAASSVHGKRVCVRAKVAVLAASAIENPRLLLVSNRACPKGLGNQNDLVGRFLMDHPSGTIGHFKREDAAAIIDCFGFYSVEHRGFAHIYTHGLVPSRELQKREGLLHCAAYMAEEHAPDDPWDALKRLLRTTSDEPIADLLRVASSPGLLAKGVGLRLLDSSAMPHRIRNFTVNAMIKLNPNFVVREFQSHGMPHKLKGVIINGISEQAPDPESRITLSDKTDALGVPMPRIDWRIGDAAPRALIRLGHLLAAELPRAGLPAPILEDWVAQERPQDGDLTDVAHSSGTTRMSDDPKRGVVNSNCQLHGVARLYVAGASVFPTAGHANPTLMIVALAIRLADHLKAELFR
jgi:choline dehydrogenase-like flavoprotein